MTGDGPAENGRGHVVLVGLMGSGKSTIGAQLAPRLDRAFLDNDTMLFRRTGRTARSIEAVDGSGELHRLEAKVLVEALAGSPPAVIAAAAAAVLGGGVGECLRGHTVVYLYADPDTLSRRVDAGDDDGHRPFVDDDLNAVLHDHFAARDPVYRGLAAIVVDTTAAPVSALVDDVIARLARR